MSSSPPTTRDTYPELLTLLLAQGKYDEAEALQERHIARIEWEMQADQDEWEAERRG